jgi:hypothetical protein
MSWRFRRKPSNDARVATPCAARLRRNLVTAVAALACALPFAREAQAAKSHYAFAVIAGTIQSADDEPASQRLFKAVGLDRRISFVVYDGNFKSPAEPCSDALFARRQQLLESSRAPLVFIPGQHDWADCATAEGGGYDVAERLDFLRQTVFADNTTMGPSPIALTRESDVARFHSYRENVRWQFADTVFVGLDVVSGNNHYLNAGGRNGEFDDRAIATGFWLEHAAEYAKRRAAHALVVIIEADPNFKRYERADRFAWLKFDRARDGYLEFKRSLVKAAQIFHGPIILIHGQAHALPGGFSIDQPLFNDKGVRLANLTRIAIAPRERSTQWIQFDVDFDRQPPFRVSEKAVPKNLPAPPALPHQEPAAPPAPGTPGLMPPIPAEPAEPGAPASEPPLLPEPKDNTPPTSSMPAPPNPTATPTRDSAAPVSRVSVQGGG